MGRLMARLGVRADLATVSRPRRHFPDRPFGDPIAGLFRFLGRGQRSRRLGNSCLERIVTHLTAVAAPVGLRPLGDRRIGRYEPRIAFQKASNTSGFRPVAAR
jgi:hypothetical protein